MCKAIWIVAAVGCGCSMGFGQAIGPGATRYDGDLLVRVDIRTAQELKTTLSLTDDVWSEHVGLGGPVDVRVTPAQWARMQAAGLRAQVVTSNIQQWIDAEGARLAHRAPAGPADGPGWFDDFKTYDEHRQFLVDLAALRPDLAQVFVAGQSFEGRDIFGIRITGPGSTANRPAAEYHAAQHAREWATPGIIAYMAQQFVTQYDTDCEIKDLVDNVEFFLIPIFNVDGYVWTWASGGDRLWRKNRRPECIQGANPRFGVDTNRNWGYQWGGPGASTDPCNDTYRGTGPFSEPETQVLRDFVLARPRIRAMMDFHSYGQLVMSPWGYTSALPPADPTFELLNNRMVDTIRAVSGKVYTPGPIYTTIYPASGGAVDWGYGTAGALAFTNEVRPVGGVGFLLQPSEILPTAVENYRALNEVSRYIAHPLDIAVNSPPVYLTPGEAAQVQVAITETTGVYAAGTAQIYTRVGASGAFTAGALTPQGGGLFGGTLPAATCGQKVQYYVQAQATDGRLVMFPVCGATNPLSATAITSSVVLSDSFEDPNAGWTVVNHASLTSGGWVRADPVGTTNGGQQAQPEDDNTPAPGVACWVTQNGTPGGQAGAADVDGGPTTLTSPVIDLSGAQGATVTFARWAYSVNGSPDPFVVEVSSDGGANWAAVSGTVGGGGWAAESFSVQDYVPLTAQVRVRFTASDNPNDSLTEAAIDDLVVSRLSCPPACYADCNGDGALNLSDFGCFQTRFALGDAYADCNGDGVKNLSDFGCFTTKFALGCP
ncbi:MAG: hypothetical protein IT437_09975 [Phycisphaerales bacterium]|nr:hypothetical protein [Phycisphaerales bacterium]